MSAPPRRARPSTPTSCDRAAQPTSTSVGVRQRPADHAGAGRPCQSVRSAPSRSPTSLSRPGDRLAFYGQGIPLDDATGTDAVFYPSPQSTAAGDFGHPAVGGVPCLREPPHVLVRREHGGPRPGHGHGGIKKFVDELPHPRGRRAGHRRPTPARTTTDRAGRVHPADARGPARRRHCAATSSSTAATERPATSARPSWRQKDKPVRILFRNQLPTGAGGNLFLPVDTTVMGSGMTPDGHRSWRAYPGMVDPQNPMCNDPAGRARSCHGGRRATATAENRATLHLHGGITPWISDGTPHQWITPAGENTGPNGGTRRA